jgi:hypothetical protein
VHAFAHAWGPGDGSVEPFHGAQASEHDETGNSIPQPARWSSLQLREAANAIASECPLLSDCGHWHECPRLHKSGHWRPASPGNSRGYRARSRVLAGIQCPLCEAPDAVVHRGRYQRSAGAAAALRDGLRPARRARLGAAPSWRCSRRRPRRVQEALREWSAPGRHIGPDHGSRARPGVRHGGDGMVSKPGAPERPWVGRSRPGRT